jgi:hypothetical protein
MSLGFVTPPRVIDPRLLLVDEIRVWEELETKREKE